MATVNGVLESVPADGSIPARVQVIRQQSLNAVLSNITSAVVLLVEWPLCWRLLEKIKPCCT